MTVFIISRFYGKRRKTEATNIIFFLYPLFGLLVVSFYVRREAVLTVTNVCMIKDCESKAKYVFMQTVRRTPETSSLFELRGIIPKHRMSVVKIVFPDVSSLKVQYL